MNTQEATKETADKTLLEALSKGDQNAFTILFNRHWESLFTFVYRLTGDEDHTKDILQDVFVMLWKNRAELYAKESFLPYLNTVAYSQVMMAFRKSKVRLQGIDQLKQLIQSPAFSDEKLLLKEVQHTVEIELDKMPKNMKACFSLSRYEDKSIRMIAAELGLSEQTVKNNISEALRRLRLSIEQGTALYVTMLIISDITKN